MLCNRQAAQEVMLNHPDLQDINLQKKIRHVESFQIELVTQEDSEAQESSGLNQLEGPSFSYVLPSQKRHILVLDVSQNMNVDRQWEMARNALFRYVNHVPTGIFLFIWNPTSPNIQSPNFWNHTSPIFFIFLNVFHFFR